VSDLRKIADEQFRLSRTPERPDHQHKGGLEEMDVLVMLEEVSEHSTVLAHVNSVPSPLNSEKPTRDVVTLYGAATSESLAMALAAAMESRRETMERSDVIRHLGLWPERGAIGDAAWRDEQSGQLVTRDFSIGPDVLRETANQLLEECGQTIRRLVAGLSMPDWPEGARRAISFTLTSYAPPLAGSRARSDSLLERYRQTDGFTFDNDGD
jgi:hypothetical protein